jgi:hypothetical protein
MCEKRREGPVHRMGEDRWPEIPLNGLKKELPEEEEEEKEKEKTLHYPNPEVECPICEPCTYVWFIFLRCWCQGVGLYVLNFVDRRFVNSKLERNGINLLKPSGNFTYHQV